MNKDVKTILRLAIILFIIAAVAAACLAGVNALTKEAIAQQTEDANNEARIAVLPDASEFEQISSDDVSGYIEAAGIEDSEMISEIFVGTKDGEIVGYTIKSLPSGYGGEIELLTGISVDGTLQGISILSSSETPGLGANASEPSFSDQFIGKSAESELVVVKSGGSGDDEILAITGATITSNAVVSGVNASIEVFNVISSGGEQ
jgi:electron transport complex protein RnfG